MRGLINIMSLGPLTIIESRMGYTNFLFRRFSLLLFGITIFNFRISTDSPWLKFLTEDEILDPYQLISDFYQDLSFLSEGALATPQTEKSSKIIKAPYSWPTPTYLAPESTKPLFTAAEVKTFSDSTLVTELRKQLNLENAVESIFLILEIMSRSTKHKSQLANLSMISSLICATARGPKFALRLIEDLPKIYADVIRLRLMIEFIDDFSGDELEHTLNECVDLLINNSLLIEKCLIRLVLAHNNDSFFYLISRIGTFDFNFELGAHDWLLDQSAYTHGPKANPAELVTYNQTFKALVLHRGSPQMRNWALSLTLKTDI